MFHLLNIHLCLNMQKHLDNWHFDLCTKEKQECACSNSNDKPETENSHGIDRALLNKVTVPLCPNRLKWSICSGSLATNYIRWSKTGLKTKQPIKQHMVHSGKPVSKLSQSNTAQKISPCPGNKWTFYRMHRWMPQLRLVEMVKI